MLGVWSNAGDMEMILSCRSRLSLCPSLHFHALHVARRRAATVWINRKRHANTHSR
jgi:hypothetical protein